VKQICEGSIKPMHVRREILLFLKVLRVAISRPVNLITCAIVAGIFVMIATAPMPSLVYIGNKPREALALAGLLFISLFGLYLLIRLAVAIFGKWREALFFACALWALLMPIVIGVITNNRWSYRDDDAKHALVAMIYDLELKQLPGKVDGAKLIDLGLSSCYPPYTGRQCWLVYVKPQSSDDLDIAQDVGNWHPIKSNTLFSLLPRWVEYGEVDVRRVNESVYSVLAKGYEGR
jgi:hypothetical protein